MAMSCTSPVFFWSYGMHDAPVLLCLHGVGSCADAFDGQRPLAERLGIRLVAWDAPGYRYSGDPEFVVDAGFSAGAEAPTGLDGWADAAAALIEAVVDGPVAVLGVSWGGVIATRLALRRRDLIGALILADSSAGAGAKPQQAAAMQQRAADLAALGPERFAAARSQRLVSPDADETLRVHVADMMAASIRMPAYGWACDSMAQTDHSGDLSSIAVPTLAVVGADDMVTPPLSSQRLAAGIRGARYAEIPAAGHLANQERPDAFNDVLAEFLATTQLMR